MTRSLRWYDTMKKLGFDPELDTEKHYNEKTAIRNQFTDKRLPKDAIIEALEWLDRDFKPTDNTYTLRQELSEAVEDVSGYTLWKDKSLRSNLRKWELIELQRALRYYKQMSAREALESMFPGVDITEQKLNPKGDIIVNGERYNIFNSQYSNGDRSRIDWDEEVPYSAALTISYFINDDEIRRIRFLIDDEDDRHVIVQKKRNHWPNSKWKRDEDVHSLEWSRTPVYEQFNELEEDDEVRWPERTEWLTVVDVTEYTSSVSVTLESKRGATYYAKMSKSEGYYKVKRESSTRGLNELIGVYTEPMEVNE